MEMTVKNNENNNQPKNRTAWYFIAAAVVLTLINLCVYQCSKADKPIETVTTDTVWNSDTILETDTFCFYQPVPKLEIINHWDTLYTPKDTVTHPIQTRRICRFSSQGQRRQSTLLRIHLRIRTEPRHTQLHS